MNMHKETEVNILLQKLFFLSAKEVRALRERFRLAPPEVIDRFIKFLGEGLQKQDALLKELLTKHPQFSAELSEFLHKETRAAAVEFEKGEQAKTKNILDTPV